MERYSRPYLRYALGVLTVVYTFNFIDRQILVILQEAIKKDMGLSDAQLGLLTGFTFAIFYVVLGLPIARIADRGVRRNVIAISLTVWSVMTAVSGAARNYWQLLIARIGVGIGEAGGSPPAHAMISDYFPIAERGRALSIYSGGVYLGIMFGYLAGGWISQAVGWRATLLVVGLPGVLIALLVRFTLHEPPRGYSENRVRDYAPLPLRDAVTLLWGLPSFRWLALATGFTAFVGYGAGNFGPSFLARVHHMPPGQIGTALGLSAGLGGLIGTWVGGWLGDRLGLRDMRWYLWLPAIALAIDLPVRLLAYTVTDLRLVVALIGLAELLYMFYLGPSIAVAHALVSPALRALISGVLFFVLNLIGLGLGPLFVGLMSDRLTPRFGAESLRWSLVMTCLAWVPAVALYLLAASRFRQDLARRAE